jgi:hypothetical protein
MESKSRLFKFALFVLFVSLPESLWAQAALPAPTPLAGPGKPVDWLFVFKFNSATFKDQICLSDAPKVGEKGIFGGKVEDYPKGKHSQQYAFATNKHPKLTRGTGCVGATLDDPLGATFAQIYNHPGYHYVVWNDQFYDHPIASQGSPHGHSKGMVAWNDSGEGFVLQVSTPSWPGSGSMGHPRQNDGNTLGSIEDDDVEVSQHFFALKLSKEDLVAVLKALANASVVTNVDKDEIVQTGGPADVQAIVKTLGVESKSKECTLVKLSSKVTLISKPSDMAAPPWQLVSAKLDGLPLRAATWWANPKIYSTTAMTQIQDWPTGLGKPGPVEIATSGTWDGKRIGLQGGEGPDFNHAKIGVSTDKSKPWCIIGDLNQQGALRDNYAHQGQKMNSSQNGRGGTFYVVENQDFFESLTELLAGGTAPENPNGPPEERPKRHPKTATTASSSK